MSMGTILILPLYLVLFTLMRSYHGMWHTVCVTWLQILITRLRNLSQMKFVIVHMAWRQVLRNLFFVIMQTIKKESSAE